MDQMRRIASISYEVVIAPRTKPFNSVASESTASFARFWHLSTGDTEWGYRELPKKSNIFPALRITIWIAYSCSSWSEVVPSGKDPEASCPQHSFKIYNPFRFTTTDEAAKTKDVGIPWETVMWRRRERSDVKCSEKISKSSSKKRWWWGWKRYAIAHGSIYKWSR